MQAQRPINGQDGCRYSRQNRFHTFRSGALFMQALMQCETGFKLGSYEFQSTRNTSRPNNLECFKHRFDVIVHLEVIEPCLASKTAAVHSQPGLAIAAALTISPDVM